MIIFFLALLFGALAILEAVWASRSLKSLRIHGECDKVMAEPGEVVTWKATVENPASFPIPFVRLHGRFPEVSVREDGRSHMTEYEPILGCWTVEEKFSLPPRSAVTRSVSMKFSRRGEYELGRFRMSAGDLLGFKEKYIDGNGKSIVIIPERSERQDVLNALGGYLGDISVRRFILEDPILTTGFREYTGREPMKSIAWTRTAVTGALQVKQYDYTAEQIVVILLNVENGSEKELEECFRLTRMACEYLDKHNIPYSLRTNGNLPGPVVKLFNVPEGLGKAHLNTILYALGRADNTRFFSLNYLVTQTLRHRRNNESYIFITPKITETEHRIQRKLETAVGNPICVLVGRTEEVPE